MTDMVELVALKLRATMEHDCGVLMKRTTAQVLARAAIEAMRELMYGILGSSDLRSNDDNRALNGRWSRMIDAALKGSGE